MVDVCMTETKTIVGLDIGGSKIAVVEGSRDAHLYQRFLIQSDGAQPFEQTFRQLTNSIEMVIATARNEGREIEAISVSVGGPLVIGEGVLINPPHLPAWHGVRLKEMLREKFPHLPVCIEHDGNAGALAELRFGVGRNRQHIRHLVFLTCGTGLGAGLIVNGQVVHGASDTAGEVGHIFLAAGGPTLYGKTGSWEGWTSGAGMVLLAQREFPHRWNENTPVKELVDAMVSDDPQALAVAALAGTQLGRGLAILVDMLNPQIIVLGSLAVALGERLLAPARRTLEQEALPQAVAACEILACALGKQIGDVAALMAAINDPQVRRTLENTENDAKR